MDEETAPEKAGYRRSAGSARGEVRRRELLERVTDEVGVNGLVDFSLRRAARAAGTTHKVLLYYFDGPEDLLTQAVLQLRERRIDRSLTAAGLASPTLSGRVLAIWPVLVGEESWVLDQAIGLAMYDPGRYAELARTASTRYLPALISLCPPQWGDERKCEVSEFVLATLRGFLVEWRTSGDGPGIEAGLAALGRALDHEEATV
ncbi:TetR/AcrR family transcriptional regulator [Streptomyces sp. SID13031]|uniref:TetR/AcrR family transcriptional regulator n=1 Tax=Streptomyces sp. SID13031 TaxID=2706046 RepID=UPI001EF3D4C0|nr:TetR/AcrR family transcriptional regulator [Streptomyces sp. SID13031]